MLYFNLKYLREGSPDSDFKLNFALGSGTGRRLGDEIFDAG